MDEIFVYDLGLDVSVNFLSKDPIPCILCDETFFEDNYEEMLLKHLLDIHNFVIGSPEELADFRHYILYWRKKMNCSKLEEYCIVYSTNSVPDMHGLAVKYYLLCDKLPEDKQLRAKLKDLKLNFITEQKKEEYKNKDFSFHCIYCSSIVTGGVSNCFHHLRRDHGFSLGNPDNIVFGEKLLDIISEMLKNLQCLHCEKTFKNHTVLREHMRKKQHKSLNPKNKKFDQFYMWNYFQPGLSWEEAKKNYIEDREPFAIADIDTIDTEDCLDDDQLWTEWKDEAENTPAVCLFCNFYTSKIPVLLTHMEEHHHFDFQSLTQKFNFYAKVKLINYIRARTKCCQCFRCDVNFTSDEDLLDHINSCCSQLVERCLWDDPLYMIPVLENDGLLIHLEDNDFDDADSSSVASSAIDEIVLPEETMPLPSILDDWRLREELTADSETGNRIGYMKSLLFFKCLFCSFAMAGERGRRVCLQHMNGMHSFNFRDAMDDVEPHYRSKIINYLRSMSELGRCFVCGKGYITMVALEDHRILEGHTDLQELSLEAILEDTRWDSCGMLHDGFAEMEENAER